MYVVIVENLMFRPETDPIYVLTGCLQVWKT